MQQNCIACFWLKMRSFFLAHGFGSDHPTRRWSNIECLCTGIWSGRELRFYHSATLCQAGYWVLSLTVQLILTIALQEDWRGWRIYPSSQNFTNGRSWSHTSVHMMPIIGSFLGTRLRGDESCICPGKSFSLLDSQGPEGLGESIVTKCFCCLHAHCHILSRSKPNTSRVFPIVALLLCLNFFLQWLFHDESQSLAK